VRSTIGEITALGAAYLAGLAVGFWSEEAIDAQWAIDHTFLPTLDLEQRSRVMARWHRAVALARNWGD
jgi:glycerol kinase